VTEGIERTELMANTICDLLTWNRCTTPPLLLLLLAELWLVVLCIVA
jgi:hypothetical protein